MLQYLLMYLISIVRRAHCLRPQPFLFAGEQNGLFLSWLGLTSLVNKAVCVFSGEEMGFCVSLLYWRKWCVFSLVKRWVCVFSGEEISLFILLCNTEPMIYYVYCSIIVFMYLHLTCLWHCVSWWCHACLQAMSPLLFPSPLNPADIGFWLSFCFFSGKFSEYFEVGNYFDYFFRRCL